jgi:PAS domain S-box-containing protein
MTNHLQAQLSLLQEQVQSLQSKNSHLQAALDEQQVLASQWVERRTRELHAEAMEQKKSEALQNVFYRIAERSTAGLSVYDFLKAVHLLLGELLYAKNFYVCLSHPSQNTVDFPYYEDEKDGDTVQRYGVPRSRGLTEFVLRTAQPQRIDAERFKLLQDSGEITEATGDLTFTRWLGVPMQMHGQVRGVLVVQGYEPGIPYSDDDAHVLVFVANHVGAALERQQAIEAMRDSEARYRSVIENVGVGVVVVQDGRMVFANPSMVRIVGHSLDFLLSHPFTATIHPEDVPTVLERHQRRLRGEDVEMNYNFRIITQTGQLRTLDLSAVLIPWGHRDATLLFVMDGTARIQAEKDQLIALHQQTALNDLKARFITMASHEFRTPLATIHGSVELLKHYEDRMSADKKHQTLLKIDDAVVRMTHMLENVLVIGRTDAGRLEFKPHALSITAFCNGLVDEMRSAMAHQLTRVALNVELPPLEQLYWLDDTLIRNIVGNLLSNAIKYSPHGGTALLSVQDHGNTLVFTVSDQGIGIPEADQAQLFASFHRASNVGTISGTGLGLSIVKEAVSCHSGEIHVSSTVGQGSTFTVTVPTRHCTAGD